MENNNSIFTLAPYKWNGIWVFDDDRVGLVKEAFVAGADTTLDLLSNNAPKCVVHFSTNPFKGYQIRLDMLQTSEFGTDFVWTDKDNNDHDVWLCPAMFLYYPEAPDSLYVQVKTAE
jgi:hypothetical protein